MSTFKLATPNTYTSNLTVEQLWKILNISSSPKISPFTVLQIQCPRINGFSHIVVLVTSIQTTTTLYPNICQYIGYSLTDKNLNLSNIYTHTTSLTASNCILFYHTQLSKQLHSSSKRRSHTIK